MKKILAVVLAAVLLACVPGAAFAGEGVSETVYEDGIVKPMFTYISAASCNLNISASGLANMTTWINCSPSVNKIRMVQYLQRYNGGWQTVNSWSRYYYSNEADWSKSVYVTSGYYRLYVYYYAYNGSQLLESITRTSNDTY